MTYGSGSKFSVLAFAAAAMIAVVWPAVSPAQYVPPYYDGYDDDGFGPPEGDDRYDSQDGFSEAPRRPAVAAGGGFDLSISVRRISGDCEAQSECTISIGISNSGPRRFRGLLWLRGNVRPNRGARIVRIGPQGWRCTQVGASSYCSRNVRRLDPGETVVLETAYRLPRTASSRPLSACIEIQWRNATGGRASMAQIQRALAARGYNPGPIDGVYGGGTRRAIARFQADLGLRVTGRPTREFVEELFADEMNFDSDENAANDRTCIQLGSLQDNGQSGDLDGQDGPDTSGEIDGSDDQSGQEDGSQDTHTKAVSQFHNRFSSAQHDKSTSRRPGEPGPAGPSIHDKTRSVIHGKMTSAEHTKAISRQHDKETSDFYGEPDDPQVQDVHQKWKSDFHAKYPSARHDTDTSAATQEPESHEKWKSEFHAKAPSSRHVKATSAARPVHQKWKSEFHAKYPSGRHITATSKATPEHEKSISSFHRKFASTRHDTATSEAKEVHLKWKSAFHEKYSSDEHVKRTSRPQPRHDKDVSAFHEKATSSDHDKATTKARVVHEKALSAFHETTRSSLHVKQTSKRRVTHKKDVSAFHEKNNSDRHESATSKLAPEHEKWKSTFHTKYTTDQHVKATSLPAEVHKKDVSEFHEKYNSLQHDKSTSQLPKYHKKDVSSAIHSKARSAVTSPLVN